MSLTKLFVFYIGGSTATSNIELHDLRFAIGAKPQDCYTDLRAQWWGTPASLHIDCWGELSQADGYDIHLVDAPTQQKEKLYFVNLGGYQSNEFTELHKNIFVVAENITAAKTKALQQITHWHTPHRDHLFEIEQAICLNDTLFKQGYFIELIPNDQVKPFQFTCQYTPIDK